MKKKKANQEQFIPHFSLLFATCCTSLSIEEATERMNNTSPTGIKSCWALASKSELPEGLDSNPWPCNDNPEWQHMYFIC